MSKFIQTERWECVHNIYDNYYRNNDLSVLVLCDPTVVDSTDSFSRNKIKSKNALVIEYWLACNCIWHAENRLYLSSYWWSLVLLPYQKRFSVFSFSFKFYPVAWDIFGNASSVSQSVTFSIANDSSLHNIELECRVWTPKCCRKQIKMILKMCNRKEKIKGFVCAYVCLRALIIAFFAWLMYWLLACFTCYDWDIDSSRYTFANYIVRN